MELFNLIYIEDLNNQAVGPIGPVGPVDPVAPVGPTLQLQQPNGLHLQFDLLFIFLPPIYNMNIEEKKNSTKKGD